MNKKIIIVLSIIIFILIIGGIFLFFTRKGEEIREEGFFGLFPTGEERELGPSGFPGPEGILPGGFESERKIGELLQLTQNAVSGAALASTTIRYVEKSTGHIYDIEPNGQNRNRISNTTILKTFESFWSTDANKVILRYFEEAGAYPSVKTFSASINPNATTTLQGIFLPQSTTAVAVSPIEERIFYLSSTEEITTGTSADFENKKQSNILTIPFGEFNVSWPNKNIITLLTKPSAEAEGYLYSLDSKTGKFEKFIGGIKGLTALVSPSGEKIIYSQSRGNGMETKIFTIKDKTSADFGLTTLPGKCVWSKIDKNIFYCPAPNNFPAGNYPDDWYQGLISFNDSLWQINLSTGETNVLINETNIDIINPFLNKDENYLIFTNKKDNTLWSLKLK